MSKYGLKIKNYEAGILYEYNLGVRDHYDSTDAMLSKSLFYDFLIESGMDVYKDKSTRDVICVQFGFGSSSYQDQLNKMKKALKRAEKNEDFEKKRKIEDLLLDVEAKKDLFDKKKISELREIFYRDGVDVHYKVRNKNSGKIEEQIIHYKMLYRTPGKAKTGSCMFINESLYDKAHEFITMGIELPLHNSPVVEIAAYSSLITSSIVGKVRIEPENILIIKDVDKFFKTDVISVEIDENKHCFAQKKQDYMLKNTLFDGQALIDESIFPSWGEGYLLLRHHFCKMAAFRSNIQLFFKDYFKDKYETAMVKDMFGNDHLVRDIKLITTENAIKWIKFNISYEYWCDWVHKNDCMFGIVKTAHKSKLGEVQKMSYQMINSLDLETMPSVVRTSVEYIEQLKSDDDVFLDYLRNNINFSNDFEVLVYLCNEIPSFIKSEYFKERRASIISSYVLKLKNGKVIQNADNLVIVGSPYAMLLHSVGEDVEKDDTFRVEDGCTQCYTERFDDGEYLAEFRSPFNSRNNLGYLHNVYHPKWRRYFTLGKQIIAINMIGTDFQDKNNGLTQWVGSTEM